MKVQIGVSSCYYEPRNRGKTQFALNVICVISVTETTLPLDNRGRRGRRRIRGVKEDESLVFVSISMLLEIDHKWTKRRKEQERESDRQTDRQTESWRKPFD